MFTILDSFSATFLNQSPHECMLGIFSFAFPLLTIDMCPLVYERLGTMVTQFSHLLKQCTCLLKQCTCLLKQRTHLIKLCTHLIKHCTHLIKQCTCLFKRCTCLLKQCTRLIKQCFSFNLQQRLDHFFLVRTILGSTFFTVV